VLGVEEFDYGTIDSLKHFQGTHPAVMQERIQRMDWTFAQTGFKPVGD